jgi:hypothetical protein
MTGRTQWAIIDARTGKLVLFSGQCPVFWLRKVAKRYLTEHATQYEARAVFKVVKVCVTRLYPARW